MRGILRQNTSYCITGYCFCCLRNHSKYGHPTHFQFYSRGTTGWEDHDITNSSTTTVEKHGNASGGSFRAAVAGAVTLAGAIVGATAGGARRSSRLPTAAASQRTLERFGNRSLVPKHATGSLLRIVGMVDRPSQNGSPEGFKITPRVTRTEAHLTNAAQRGINIRLIAG